MQLVDNVIKYHPMTCNLSGRKRERTLPIKFLLTFFYNLMIVYRYHAVINDKRLNIVE